MIFLIFVILCNFFIVGYGRCYFPGELQGLWETQAAPDVVRTPIIYSMVNITSSHISTWGECHKKIDDNIILAHNSRSRASPCYRCFRLVVASVNVAALLSSGLESCFLFEKAALASCPTSEGASVHLTLYKIPSPGSTGRQEMQCPLSGMYHFSYYKGERGGRGGAAARRDSALRCEQPTSEMSNCPFGFSLRLQYSDCTFEHPTEAEWHCLGTWKGLNGQTYTAMWDINAKGNDERPKYKCGIFRHDPSKRRVHLAFSRDSTCINELFSAEDGNERYVLNKVPPPLLPPEAEKYQCRFATNLRGHWHNLHIRKSTLTFRDEENFETLHMKCLRDSRNKEKYIVHIHNNCRKSFFSCIMLKRRSVNIIEIKLGRKERGIHTGICDSLNLSNSSSWITLAKMKIESTPSCPIVGTYQGHLPDAPGFCAELYSDCSRTDTMYYAVDECGNRDNIYERNAKLRGDERKLHKSPQRLRPSIFEVRQDGDHFQPKNFERTSYINSRDQYFPPTNLTPKRTILNIFDDKRRGIGRDKRSAIYHVNNPRTTTISYNWGIPRTTTAPTTTPLPLWTQRNDWSDVDRRTNYSPANNWKVNRTLSHFAPRTRLPSFNYPSRLPSRPPSSINPPFYSQDSLASKRHRDRNLNENGRVYGNFEGRNQKAITWTPSSPTVDGRVDINSNGNERHLYSEMPSRTVQHLYNSPRAWRNDGQLHREMQDALGNDPHIKDRWRDVNNTHNTMRLKKTLPKKQEREYRCLGHWKEEGRIYALTHRTDIHTYECFEGIEGENGVVFIKEAGSSCKRGVAPNVFGMQTSMKAGCPTNRIIGESLLKDDPSKSQVRKVSPTRPPWVPSTTRPWKPITGRPRRSNSSPLQSCFYTILCIISLSFIIQI